MDWNALVGALIGAGIPGILTYLGLRRERQSADAGALGTAILLLDRVNPERVTLNFNRDNEIENTKWAELREQLAVARERLLIVSAGHPRLRIRELALATEVKIYTAFEASHWAVHDMQANRDNPEWLDHARSVHADAEATLRQLIDENFSWSVFGRRPLRVRRRPKAMKPKVEAVSITGDQPPSDP